jgi:hypothetical protein
VGLERRPLSLASTIEELLERKSSGSGLENGEYGYGDPSRYPRDTLYPQKLALISPTSGGRSVGIVRSWTKATVFVLFASYEVGITVREYKRALSSPENVWCRPSNRATRCHINLFSGFGGESK